MRNWIEDRLGLGSFCEKVLGGTQSAKAGWLKSVGVALFVLILVECLTGILLSTQYAPSTSGAYSSVQAIEATLSGRLLRGIHHWASAALICLFGLSVVRMLLGREYGNRNEIPWFVALIGLHLALFFQLTGHALPWDTNAASTVIVEAGIAGSAWVVGPSIQKFLLAGDNLGQSTLNLWHGLHVGLLPLAALALLGIPALLHRMKASAETATPEPDAEPYYPNHVAKGMALSLGFVLLFAVMSIVMKTPLEAEATSANLSGYNAKAEWYVAALHTLTVIPPFNTATFEPVVTMVLPGLTVAALFLLPFLDKRTAPGASKPLKAMVIMGLIGFLGLSAYSMFFEHTPESTATASSPESQKPKVAAPPKVDAALVALGMKAYEKNGCAGCHKIAGKGGAGGPDLSKAGELHPDRTWQIEHLKKPDAKVPGSTMPAYGHLKPDELKAMAEYMVSLR